MSAFLMLAGLQGCLTESSRGKIAPYTGPELPLGDYFILRDVDDYNRYDQYFIVRAAGEWEFVEIGRRRTDSALVQVTRQVGSYALERDTLIVLLTHVGAISSQVAITEDKLKNFPFARQYSPSGYIPVRDLKEDRFSARDLFVGKNGWNTYIRSTLPLTLPAPALGALPRGFEPPLFSAPDTVRVFSGDTLKLDLAGPAPNPKTAMYYLKRNILAQADSSRSGRFSIPTDFEGNGYMGAWARDAGGNRTAIKEIAVIATRVKPIIPAFGPYTVHVEDTIRFSVEVRDPQNDLAEVQWDFDGDGEIDWRGKSPNPVHTYRQPGNFTIRVIAVDSQGHVDSLRSSIVVLNDPPKIDSLPIDPATPHHYIRDVWKGRIKVSDRENNLIDSAWWDFDGNGKNDTVTRLADTVAKIFDSTGTWEAVVTVKDRAGAVTSGKFRLSVQNYKLLKAFVSFGAGESQRIVGHDGKLWVLGGRAATPDIWSSPDGVEWTKSLDHFPMGDQPNFPVVAFKGRLWLFGGDNGNTPGPGDIWNSADGIAWEWVPVPAPWGRRMNTRVIVYRDRLWFFGGLGEDRLPKKDVWTSSDGVAWQQVSADLPWPINGTPVPAVFDDKLIWLFPYAAGGNREERYYSTTDGTTWTEGSFISPWTTRYSSDFFEYRGKLWLLGGDGGIWKSQDGRTWTLHTRLDHIKTNNHATVFQNKIFWVTDRDVYMTEEP